MHMQSCRSVNLKLLLFSHPCCRCCHCCLSSLILRCDYCNRGHLDKVDQSDHRKITIHSKKVGCGPIRKSKKKKQTNNKLLKASNLNIDSKHFSRKQNVSPDNVFLFETFHITPRRHICLRHAVLLLSTCNFFPIITSLGNKITISSKKYNQCLHFLPPSFTLTDPSGNTRFFSGGS